MCGCGVTVGFGIDSIPVCWRNEADVPSTKVSRQKDVPDSCEISQGCILTVQGAAVLRHFITAEFAYGRDNQN